MTPTPITDTNLQSLDDVEMSAAAPVASTSSAQVPETQDAEPKPVPTLYSCLRIPVEGAIPIESESGAAGSSTDRSESTRAPRQSKTDALAALENNKRPSSPELADDDDEPVDVLAEKYRNYPPIRVSPSFDISSVKTTSPAGSLPSSHKERPFGLTDCPEFYPTAEEFKDPMAYVRSISPTAKEYGICKIIPPEGWKMPFVTDSESFRFKTRLQRLNSIEASSRAKLNFLEQLYRFHSQQGNTRVAVPTINHKPLDLWLLRKEVHKLGGYEEVTRNKKWSEVGRLLGYRGVPGLSNQIKNSFYRVILPFEQFCEHAKNSPALAATLARETPFKVSSHAPVPNGKFSRFSASAPPSPLTATSSPLSEPPEEDPAKETDQLAPQVRRSARVSSQEQIQNPKKTALFPSPVVPPPVFHDKAVIKGEQHCEICGKKNRGEEMLLCDGCDCGFHMFCLDPPLHIVPKDHWFCFTCLAGTGTDYGFDEGEEHSLSSFQARDQEFRRFWFESHPPRTLTAGDPTANRIGDVTVSEFDVENEFWRLVQSPDETVEIEYGADIHSITHGSAMPTMETHPLDPYSKDPWNLNNIPIVADSLLRFIKSDISGMTSPWTYVGMAFSTFCWHNEDHYTYSINFMHWGETKTWYGIPGDDAEKFEAAIKCEAPELFETQPDLLFQLVTLMNPKRLTDAGVRVYACNQRAGEFVITYPKSYHAGFNHGLNFNEAVNFALPDWLSYGRDCVQRYREHRKLPVFSHDELLITITQQSSSIKIAMWLADSLKEMTDRELSDRARARSLGFLETLEEFDRPEEQYQCHVCKMFCYLSQIACSCHSKVVCVEHHDLLCNKKAPDHLIFRLRFPDSELRETHSKIAERSTVPSAWQGKLTKLLEESARPPLRSLRAIFAEGERITYHIPQIATLRKCVNRANEWVEAANAFIVRKQSRKRMRRSRAGSAEEVDRPERGLDDLYSLLQEVEMLGFDCPEISSLSALAQQAEEMKAKAAALLTSSAANDDREAFVNECKRLLIDGSSLNVLLEELVEIEKIVDREQLIKELEEKLEDPDAPMTLEEVRQLLTRARTCNLETDNQHIKLLEGRQRAGDNWEERAKNILAQPVKTIDELDDFANMESTIPIDPTILDRLMSARAKAKDFEKQAKAWLSPEADTPRPRPQDVTRLVIRAEKDYSIAAITEIKRFALIALDLETRAENVLKHRYRRRDGENVFETIKTWRDYAASHLSLFTLPMFEKLEIQIRLHNQWIQDLPWYCREHGTSHGQEVVDDVLECTRPEDDLPPADEYFTCICNQPVRPPPPGIVSDAVQCDHCYARFHGECAKTGGSCPFCDHHHWNGEIHKDRSWHFCYMPTMLQTAPDISKSYASEWKQLETIVNRVDRLSAVIGQFLHFTSQPANQRVEFIHQVRHYMRKLYKIQFAVSPSPDVSFGLDLAGLHRILAGRPPPPRPKKRRRPKFVFGQDIDSDWHDRTRCICRGQTPYLLHHPTIQCDLCSKLYHARCVFFPPDLLAAPTKNFICPLCCLRKNKVYAHSDIRVLPPHNEKLQNIFVDTRMMIETYSKDIIYLSLERPKQSTLFVDLVRYIPGQSEMPAVATNGHSGSHHHSAPSHSTVLHHVPKTPSASVSQSSSIPTASSAPSVPPPPPWAPWSQYMSSPSTHRHNGSDHLSSQPSRKRRLVDENDESISTSRRRLISGEPEPRPGSQSSQHSPGSHAVTLSPSLAMMMNSPLESPYDTSPRMRPPAL